MNILYNIRNIKIISLITDFYSISMWRRLSTTNNICDNVMEPLNVKYPYGYFEPMFDQKLVLLFSVKIEVINQMDKQPTVHLIFSAWYWTKREWTTKKTRNCRYGVVVETNFFSKLLFIYSSLYNNHGRQINPYWINHYTQRC